MPNNVPSGKSKVGKGSGAGNGPGTGNDDPPPVDGDGEQADLNYGKKAANLQLNRLEDQVRRGNVDKKWLKRHGWKSKEDALKKIHGIRRRVANPDPQFAEFLKSLRDVKFQSKQAKRAGENVRKKSLDGVGNTGRTNVPPHLRNYYKAFRRSVNR